MEDLLNPTTEPSNCKTMEQNALVYITNILQPLSQTFQCFASVMHAVGV